MIYALVTFFGVIFFGGLSWYVLDKTYTIYLNAMTVAYPLYFTNPYVSFVGQLINWLPLLILIIAMVSALVIELRRKNPGAYIQL